MCASLTDKECELKVSRSCDKVLLCGHYCCGVRGETECLPCLVAGCSGDPVTDGPHAEAVKAIIAERNRSSAATTSSSASSTGGRPTITAPASSDDKVAVADIREAKSSAAAAGGGEDYKEKDEKDGKTSDVKLAIAVGSGSGSGAADNKKEEATAKGAVGGVKRVIPPVYSLLSAWVREAVCTVSDLIALPSPDV